MATSLSNQILHPLSKPTQLRKSQKTLTFSINCLQVSSPKLTKRASLGLSTITTLFSQIVLPLHAEEAENNGYWLTGPLPNPTVDNKIANEETGTRSFLRKGIYIANIGVEGSAYRIKHCAFDLLALGDMIGKDVYNYMRKYLTLKSTTMYYDFDKLISAASDDKKEPMLNLANRLFDSIEKLDDAIKTKSDVMVKSCHDETSVILEEVMVRMA